MAQDIFKVMNKVVVLENKNNFSPEEWADFKMAKRPKKKSSNDGQDGTPIRSAMSAKKRMNSGSESPEEIITQQLLAKICKVAGSPEICVDALWFKVPDCTCPREHEEVSILLKFGVHQVLLLHHDSLRV